MRRAMIVGASGLAASLALGGPVNDGTLVGDEGCYGSILWFQNQPTAFGDNRPDNVPPAGDALTAFSGVEMRIPLAALGNPDPNTIKVGGWVISGDHNFLSNQVVGSLANLDNLGNPPIDFMALSGQQWITLTPTTDGAAPDVDGFLDGTYGGHQDGFAQTNFTGFGDAQHGNFDGGSGSEIDAIYAWTDGTDLYLLVAGNLEANSNGLNLFFDSSIRSRAGRARCATTTRTSTTRSTTSTRTS